ncbi:fumarate hydratase C-terminal domain-containing protein [Candidatus Peregrinibacteria bacterium]|nr:fumarate hydratase C-terminal domain-containing protein [Candidatus Peregrinibacteria bacterium]
MHHKLITPLTRSTVLKLHAGDTVSLSGEVITARDRAHIFLLDNCVENNQKFPFSLQNGVIYHCGPIVRKNGKNYEIIAAGPTTSSRLEYCTDTLIEKYGISLIIGKAGMGQKTLAGLQGKAVYCAAVGGAAQVLAQSVKRVKNVYKLKEFGEPEAFWVLEVKNFPLIVTMDAHGKSLHQDIREISQKKLNTFLGI